MPRFDAELVKRYDRPGPRYTSYPTALQFTPRFDVAQLTAFAACGNVMPVPRPLSLYLHIPFCCSPCFYCGCNRLITRDLARGARYAERLLCEIERIATLFDGERQVVQLHLGGGTPNFLSVETLVRLIQELGRRFHLSTNRR